MTTTATTAKDLNVTEEKLAELVGYAQETAFHHNNRSAEYATRRPGYIDTLEFTGKITARNCANELIPNPKTIGLMDSAKVVRYEAEFRQHSRSNGKGRNYRRFTEYTVHSDYIVVEVGSHYDQS